MANLSNLIRSRAVIAKGLPVEPREISVFSQSNQLVYSVGSACTENVCFCISVPCTVTIEAWGSSGRSHSSCCCGISMPGNSGAYGSRTIQMGCGWICAISAPSSRSSSFVTTARCGATQIIVCDITNNCCYCMCVESGFDGRSVCFSTSSPYACTRALGFCGTDCLNSSCGIVCNISTSVTPAQSFGGTINCAGGISCIVYNNVDPISLDNFVVVESSPYIINRDRTKIIARASASSCRSGMFAEGLYESVSYYGQMLNYGQNLCYCWAGDAWCACYPARGCDILMPPGIPGASSSVCGGIVDYGSTGGNSKILIRFSN